VIRRGYPLRGSSQRPRHQNNGRARCRAVPTMCSSRSCRLPASPACRGLRGRHQTVEPASRKQEVSRNRLGDAREHSGRVADFMRDDLHVERRHHPTARPCRAHGTGAHASSSRFAVDTMRAARRGDGQSAALHHIRYAPIKAEKKSRPLW
jgi:hypothetical protein